MKIFQIRKLVNPSPRDLARLVLARGKKEEERHPSGKIIPRLEIYLLPEPIRFEPGKNFVVDFKSREAMKNFFVHPTGGKLPKCSAN